MKLTFFQPFPENPPADADIIYLEGQLKKFFDVDLKEEYPNFVQSSVTIDRSTVKYEQRTGIVEYDMKNIEEFFVTSVLPPAGEVLSYLQTVDLNKIGKFLIEDPTNYFADIEFVRWDGDIRIIS